MFEKIITTWIIEDMFLQKWKYEELAKGNRLKASKIQRAITSLYLRHLKSVKK